MAYFSEIIPRKPVPTKAFPKNIRGLLACNFFTGRCHSCQSTEK